ncbi:MAG: 6-phosphofructokinase [Acidobacteria bacterium]|nr:6-phosphofructokinase [Acidobacteriota bacterium]
MSKRIGILTGGGDVPGLNSVIKSVTYGSTELGWNVTGLRRGWEALTHIDFDDPASVKRYVEPLDRQVTRNIDRTGGTHLHSSRTNPAKMKTLPKVCHGQTFPATTRIDKKTNEEYVTYDISSHVLRNIGKLGLDYLVAIGGDDTLSYAAHLDRLGFKVVAIPKTMDNDVRNTEYCIGFSTAISRAMNAIERQRTTIGSHERIGIFRIFGRDAGYTALYTAYATSIRCGIPEYHFDHTKMVELLLKDKRDNPSSYSLVVLSEGANWVGHKLTEYGEPDAYGHRKKMSVAEDFSDALRKIEKEETVVSDLTYDLRGGAPDFVDRLVATTFASMAIDAIRDGLSGRMTAINHGVYSLEPIPDPALGPRKVDVESMYNTERYRPRYDRKLGLPIFLTKP